jgi:hypothetical protein
MQRLRTSFDRGKHHSVVLVVLMMGVRFFVEGGILIQIPILLCSANINSVRVLTSTAV